MATMIRSLIDAVKEPEETSDLSTNKPTNFGNVQFGARHKAWSFMELEELANSDPLYKNFRKDSWMQAISNRLKIKIRYLYIMFAFDFRSNIQSIRLLNIDTLSHSMNQR